MLTAREKQFQRNGFSIYLVILYLKASFNYIITKACQFF